MKSKIILTSILTLGLALSVADLLAAGGRGSGSANRGATNPQRTPAPDCTGTGPQGNPSRTPKQDGTGGPGKPANPNGQQGGTCTGSGPRG